MLQRTLLVLLLAATAAVAAPDAGAPSSGKKSYSEARAGFTTRLLVRGPSPQEGAPLGEVKGARRVTFASGGHTLTAYVTPPRKGQAPARPAVLFLHGGFAFAPDDWDMTKPLRDAGYVVMMPVLRGENGQPGAYSFLHDEVDDVLAAADALARQPGVDPARLYVTGHSVGGTLALLAAATSPRRFRAATSLSGSPDQRGWLRGQEEFAPFDVTEPRELFMRSPVFFAHSFQCPVRMFFGDEEGAFFRAASRATVDNARKAGLDVEATGVPGDHFSSVPEGLKRTLAFFATH